MGPADRMDGQTKATLEVIERFNQAFGRHDVDGVMRAMADDCVFENTCPPPDGEFLEPKDLGFSASVRGGGRHLRPAGNFRSPAPSN